jgi:hypothetical protein
MFAIYERTASIRTSLDDRNDEFPCTAIVAQLGRMLAKEIVKTELATMCEIEGLFFASGKIGAKNSIAAWVCLWTLIFVYRDHMIHISAFTFSPYHGMILGTRGLLPYYGRILLRFSEMMPRDMLLLSIYTKLLPRFTQQNIKLRLHLILTGGEQKLRKCLVSIRN